MCLLFLFFLLVLFFFTALFKALRLYPSSHGKDKLAGPLFNRKYVIMSAANPKTKIYYAAASFTVMLVSGDTLDCSHWIRNNKSVFGCTDKPNEVPDSIDVPEVMIT